MADVQRENKVTVTMDHNDVRTALYEYAKKMADAQDAGLLELTITTSDSKSRIPGAVVVLIE